MFGAEKVIPDKVYTFAEMCLVSGMYRPIDNNCVRFIVCYNIEKPACIFISNEYIGAVIEEIWKDKLFEKTSEVLSINIYKNPL